MGRPPADRTRNRVLEGTIVRSVLLLLIATMSAMTRPVAVVAQEAVLRGVVRDAADLRPLPSAAVSVGTGDRQTLTDDQGRFVLPGLDPGVVTVEVELIGYARAIEVDVVLRSSRSTYVEVLLDRQALELEGIVVGAPAFRVPDAAPTSVQILSSEELRRTPGGLLDVSRTLLSLPGVLGGVDNRNDLLVRGGGPGENAYYLDGIRIPQINHFATQGASGGALGLVNVDFIRDTEFYTGAFPVRYGDALSSVLAIRNRPGSPEGVRGDFTLGATEAALNLDGPAGQDGNWLFSLRRSYLQFLFAALGLPIRPDYWDAQFRFEYDVSPEDRLLFIGIGALDNFDIVPPAPGDDFENTEIAARVIDNDQRSYTVGGSWRRLVSGGYVTTSVSRSVSDFAFQDPGTDGVPVLLNESLETDTRLSVQADFAGDGPLSFSGGIEADRAGIDATVFQRAIPGGSLTEDVEWSDDVSLWKLAAHGQVTAALGRVTLTGGLRADEVGRLDHGFEWSPRASGRVDLGRGFSAQAGLGLFHQAPALLSLSVEEDGEPVNLQLRQMRNRQVAAGVGWTGNEGLRITAEGFYKRYDRVPLLAGDPRVAVSNLGGDYGFVGAEPLIDDGEGRARGVELFVQQRLLGSVYLLGAYTLSWSEFAGVDGTLRPSSWDRRHALDLTGGYRLGDSWEFGAKLRVLSGLATTPWDLDASEEAYAITGRGVPDWNRIGEVRTPAYVRLDVRAERRLTFTGWNAVLYLDLQNILGRENAVGYAYTEDPAFPDRIRPIDGVGFLPTFGFSVEF